MSGLLPSTLATRARANGLAFDRMCAADPVLVAVAPAGAVVPGMTRTTILTSGAPMPWSEYSGGQRRAIVYGAVYEGLASSVEDAQRKLDEGSIQVAATHEHGCVGSVAGIYTASMPVFVVENQTNGNLGFCNFYEGESRRRLNYGVYDEGVRQGLQFIEDVLAPVIGEAVDRSGGVPLKPIMRRALHMGDELHSRNTAATLLFTRELVPHFLGLRSEQVSSVLRFLKESDYFFLRLSMAAAKATADAAHGVDGSSVVTAMTISCRGFAIRVSGLGDRWFRGPHATADVRLFEGYTERDVEWIGGESQIAETIGLGGFAQAAAFALQEYQGGSPQAMAAMNLSMYDITVGENTDYRIPYFSYRGTPTGIDVFRVIETGKVPVIDAGLAGRSGGQIGAGILRAPLECFADAAKAYEEEYAIRAHG